MVGRERLTFRCAHQLECKISGPEPAGNPEREIRVTGNDDAGLKKSDDGLRSNDGKRHLVRCDATRYDRHPHRVVANRAGPESTRSHPGRAGAATAHAMARLTSVEPIRSSASIRS